MQRKSSKALLTTAAMFLAASCTNSDGSTGRVGSPVWFRSTTPEMRFAYFSEICEGYGFRTETIEMSQCVQREAIAARDDSNQRSQASIAAYSSTYSAVMNN